MREKEVKEIKEQLENLFGIEVFSERNAVDSAEGPDFNLIFVDNEVIGVIYEGKPFLTIRGLLRYRPESYAVTIDMGAVPYVANGADVMGPGIVNADPKIKEGSMVWIRDTKNGTPLAIGIAIRNSDSMLLKSKGKAVKILHNVGDKIWKLDE